MLGSWALSVAFAVACTARSTPLEELKSLRPASGEPKIGTVFENGASENQLSILRWFAEYSANAHRPSFPVGEKVQCPAPEDCPGISGSEGITYLADISSSKIHGFVAEDKKNKQIVLAFKGMSRLQASWQSLNEGNILRNSRLKSCEDELGVKGCKAHGGLLGAYLEQREAIEDAMRKATEGKRRKKWAVVVTGHSQGGALAALATAFLSRTPAGRPDFLFTFGAYMAGNAELANHVSRGAGVTARAVTHENDAWPSFPRRSVNWLTGGLAALSDEYRAVWPELHLRANRDLQYDNSGGGGGGGGSSRDHAKDTTTTTRPGDESSPFDRKIEYTPEQTYLVLPELGGEEDPQSPATRDSNLGALGTAPRSGAAVHQYALVRVSCRPTAAGKANAEPGTGVYGTPDFGRIDEFAEDSRDALEQAGGRVAAGAKEVRPDHD